MLTLKRLITVFFISFCSLNFEPTAAMGNSNKEYSITNYIEKMSYTQCTTELCTILENQNKKEELMFILSIFCKYGQINWRYNNKEGQTPCHIVIQNPNFSIKEKIEILSLFFKHGAEVNCKNKEDDSLLYYAVVHNNKATFEEKIELVSFLAQEGIDINYYNRCTPLHTAAANRDTDMIQALMLHGAKVAVYEETAYDLIKTSNKVSQETKNLLLNGLTFQSKNSSEQANMLIDQYTKTRNGITIKSMLQYFVLHPNSLEAINKKTENLYTLYTKNKKACYELLNDNNIDKKKLILPSQYQMQNSMQKMKNKKLFVNIYFE